MYGSKYLFNHEAFEQEAESYMQEADAGNYEHLLKQARKVADAIPPGGWILEGQGTILQEVYSTTAEPPTRVGFAFLLLLSQHLIPYTEDGAEDVSLSAMAEAATYLGWNTRDIMLLDDGMSLTALMKPELVDDPLQRPSPGDSRWFLPSYYWWWVRPLNAYHTGWLSRIQVKDLHGMMKMQEDRFQSIPVESLNWPKPLDQERFLRYCKATMRFFEVAKNQGLGIFHNVSSFYTPYRSDEDDEHAEDE